MLVLLESDGSIKQEADIAEGCAESICRKSPASGMADFLTFIRKIFLTAC